MRNCAWNPQPNVSAAHVQTLLLAEVVPDDTLGLLSGTAGKETFETLLTCTCLGTRHEYNRAA